jgi:hypothetical protein
MMRGINNEHANAREQGRDFPEVNNGDQSKQYKV